MNDASLDLASPILHLREQKTSGWVFCLFVCYSSTLSKKEMKLREDEMCQPVSPQRRATDSEYRKRGTER